MTLSGDDIMRATAEPYLYSRAPFLIPMRQSAMAVHEKFKTNKGKCAPCLRGLFVKASQQIGSAFCKLILDESKKTPNSLQELKAALTILLEREIKEMVITYKLGDEEKELRF